MTVAVARSRTALLAAVSEADFQAEVVRRAELHGWLCHHARPARTERGWRTPVQGKPGFPDLVLARGGRLLLWELKTTRGKASVDQQQWLSELAQAPGVDVRIVSPMDWAYIEGALA